MIEKLCVKPIDKVPDADCSAQISPPSPVTVHPTPESESDEEAEHQEPLDEADASRHSTLLTLL